MSECDKECWMHGHIKSGNHLSNCAAYPDQLRAHIEQLYRDDPEMAIEIVDGLYILIKELEEKVKELELEKSNLTIKLMDADRVAEAIDKQVNINQLDARSLIADARLDYGEPNNYKYLTTTNKDNPC